jgi:hypothetical protein
MSFMIPPWSGRTEPVADDNVSIDLVRYRFTPLPDDTSFRVLHLEPGSCEDPLAAELHEHVFERAKNVTRGYLTTKRLAMRGENLL